MAYLGGPRRTSRQRPLKGRKRSPDRVTAGVKGGEPMKTGRLLLTISSLALLWAGCHGQTSGPTAPSSAGDLTQVSGEKKGGQSMPTYTYVHHGDLGQAPSPGDAVGGNSGGIGMGMCCGVNNGIEQLVLKNVFLAANFADAAACFSAGDFTVNFDGYVRDGRGGVTGEYYFEAFGTDRSTVFKYRLDVTAAEVTGDFPPAAGGGVATIEWASVGQMNTEGSGKGKKGGNAGSACVGEVSFTQSTGITVTGVN